METAIPLSPLNDDDTQDTYSKKEEKDPKKFIAQDVIDYYEEPYDDTFYNTIDKVANDYKSKNNGSRLYKKDDKKKQDEDRDTKKKVDQKKKEDDSKKAKKQGKNDSEEESRDRKKKDEEHHSKKVDSQKKREEDHKKGKKQEKSDDEEESVDNQKKKEEDHKKSKKQEEEHKKGRKQEKSDDEEESVDNQKKKEEDHKKSKKQEEDHKKSMVDKKVDNQKKKEDHKKKKTQEKHTEGSQEEEKSIVFVDYTNNLSSVEEALEGSGDWMNTNFPFEKNLSLEVGKRIFKILNTDGSEILVDFHIFVINNYEAHYWFNKRDYNLLFNAIGNSGLIRIVTSEKPPTGNCQGIYMNSHIPVTDQMMENINKTKSLFKTSVHTTYYHMKNLIEDLRDPDSVLRIKKRINNSTAQVILESFIGACDDCVKEFPHVDRTVSRGNAKSKSNKNIKKPASKRSSSIRDEEAEEAEEGDENQENEEDKSFYAGHSDEENEKRTPHSPKKRKSIDNSSHSHIYSRFYKRVKRLHELSEAMNVLHLEFLDELEEYNRKQ